MNRKICLIIGHSPYDSGAINVHTNDTEFKYNTEVAHKLKDVLESSYEVDIYNRGNAKAENFTYLNSCGYDFIISLHCNSFNEKASGTEVLYWNTSTRGLKLATEMSEAVSTTLGIVNRGAKSIKDGDRGSALLKKTKALCLIVEPFFIDNLSDLDKGKSLMDSYVNTLGQVIKNNI